MKPQNLNTRYLRYLMAVVEEGSFSRAAERLRVSQPAISRRIQMLEDELGFALLERLPRKVVVTRQGQAMLPAFRDLLQASAETGDLVDQLLQNKVRIPRIGVAVYTVQPERSALLADFEAAFPNTSFEIETGYTRALLHGLWEGKFDLLAVSSPIPDERFEYIILRWFPVELVVPQNSPLAALRTVPTSALYGLTVASWERARLPRMFDQMVRPLEDFGVNLVFPDDQGKLGILAYAADHGVAAIRSLDEHGEDDLRRVGMVARPLEDVRPVAAVMLLRLARSDRPAGAMLWNFARRWVEQRKVPQRREDLPLN
ncbi:LysR family transcriptional regulator [Sphingomonadaceae bacterium G21617-S1]|jgi:DNA-binding transcriptional LysR family regulator|uniref:LysR family transcriptional regulator n=1 Tax=Rhizorhabdus sp. TaxID=1968843 RepID=UPI001983A584|nr:LysR family transcriptional regulator [Rhizorhabdus sp.]MBD3759281.1 LysR family transcriptional regulator [Rhizorhabdus sp.]MCZ4341944.1 LysR family transcriptional regulator [Sphingomonadaceae bacterium G21617-S1]